MSALTSLLVRDRIVPVSKIEEALQSQVLSGGDIDTVLLEMDLVPEDVLSAYRAALFGLLPASRDEVMRAPREALGRMPREMARDKNVLPLLLDGRALVVAAIEPLSPVETRQLRELLGYEVSVRIVTRPRLLAGLAHHYGLEVSPRTRRLLDALRRREPGIIPYVRPPSPSVMPATYRAEADDRDTGDSHELLVRSPVGVAAMPSGLTLSEPGRSLLPQGSPRFDRQLSPVSVELSQPILAPASEGAHGGEALETQEPAPPASRAQTENVLTGLEVGRATTLPPSNLSAHIARATRGPISVERATQLLGLASHRDDALFVLLRYAQQYFDFVGIFSVGKEGARGRVAHGAGLSQELMEHVLVPLEGGGLFARAARDRRALVGDLTSTDEERAAAALLGRPAGRPALVVPVLLRGRTVLLVHADRDAEGISLEDASAIAEVVAPLKDALSRIIVQNKALGRSSRQPSAQAEDKSGTEPPRLSEGPAETPAPPGRPEPSDASPPLGEHHKEPVSADEFLAHTAEAPVVAHEESELVAVDLEAVGRPFTYLRSEPPEARDGEGPTSDDPGTRGEAWVALPGVPRSAPPPPRRESLSPQGASVGAYRYVAASGLVAESIRQPREVSRAVSPAAPALTEPETPKALPEEVAQPAEQAPKPHVKRLSLVTPEGDQPSVIIDMGDQVSFLVDALMHAPRGEEPPQVAELLRLGESALPVLIQHFPGPLWISRAEIDDSVRRAGRIPRGRDVSAVACALCAFGAKAAPYLAGKLASGEDAVGLYALLVAGEIVHPDLLDSVARRMLGNDAALRFVALDVLRRYARLPQFAMVLRALADLSERSGKDPRRQLLALEALGALRDGRSLQTLIARLNDGSEAVVQLAHKALVELTAQDFGDAVKRWEAWAEQAGGQHRIEWLIEGLMHTDPGLRGLASDELKRETQQYFGYHPALPKRDRELAQRKYREWWHNEGKANFAY